MKFKDSKGREFELRVYFRGRATMDDAPEVDEAYYIDDTSEVPEEEIERVMDSADFSEELMDHLVGYADHMKD